MRFLKSPQVYLALLIVYAITGIALLPSYQHQINPDGVSYISVAQNYLEGDFENAVNGYWSPLFSWLLIPFLAVGMEPLLATKVMALFIGLLLFAGADSLASRYRMGELHHNLMLITLVPLVLLFVYQTITPDLLNVAILLFYFAHIFNSNYSRHKKAGLICGALGGLAFLAKNYSFPFFLIHFVGFSLIHYFSTANGASRKTVLNNLFAGLLVFFMVTGTWIGIISAKYGELTIGTNVAYNLALTTSSNDHPIYHAGLIEPSDEDASSVWEDPSEIEVQTEESDDVFETIRDFCRRILRNAFVVFHAFRGFSIASLLVAFIAVLYCIPLTKTRIQNIIFFSFATILLYCSGYTFIWVLPRYLWVAAILMLGLGFHILDKVFKMGFLSRRRRAIILLFFVLSFWIAPVRHLKNNIGAGEKNYLLAKELSEYQISGSIVANQDWNETSYLAFYNGYKFLGLTESYISAELFQLLQEQGVDYYFFWTHDDEDPEAEFPFLEEWEDATENEVDFIRVYSLQN